MYEAFRINGVFARTRKDLLHVDFENAPEGMAVVLHPERAAMTAALELKILGEPMVVSDDDADVHFTPEQRRGYETMLLAYLERVRRESPPSVLPSIVRVSWPSRRLTFIRRYSEALAPTERFAVMVENGPTYVMSRSEFEAEFANVAASRSYLEYGSYNYSQTPAKAGRFVMTELNR